MTAALGPAAGAARNRSKASCCSWEQDCISYNDGSKSYRPSYGGISRVPERRDGRRSTGFGGHYTTIHHGRDGRCLETRVASTPVPHCN